MLIDGFEVSTTEGECTSVGDSAVVSGVESTCMAWYRSRREVEVTGKRIYRVLEEISNGMR